MTKALALARAFHRAGHRVVLVETRQVPADRAPVLARGRPLPHRARRRPRPGYADALRRDRAPRGRRRLRPGLQPGRQPARRATPRRCSPSTARSSTSTRTPCARSTTSTRSRRPRPRSGWRCPATHRITDPEQVVDFDAGDGRSVRPQEHRLRPGAPARPDAAAAADARRDGGVRRARCRSPPDTPWILQELVEGQEFCTHSTVRDGVVQAYCCCPSSAFQVNYAMVDKPEIEAWVRRFVGRAGHHRAGVLRLHRGRRRRRRTRSSATRAPTRRSRCFHDHPDLARAYLEDGVPEVRPPAVRRPTYWLYHELWRLLTASRAPRRAAAHDRSAARDAVFDVGRPAAVPDAAPRADPVAAARQPAPGNDWIRIDFNIGKLVEAAG